MEKQRSTSLLILLGNLAGVGPFVTDFYLPSFPKLAEVFSAQASVVQMSLTACMFGLAIGQMIFGPISDRYGRRRPLMWSLALFVLATAGCVFSSDIHWFIFFRLLQGLTGACGLVISKVVVTDVFTGKEMAKIFAVLSAVQFLAPILAPVLGGVVFSLTSWQGIFFALGAWGIALLWGGWRMTETLPEDKRLKMPILRSFGCFAVVVRNRKFLIMTLLLAFVSVVIFSYISASPFLFQNHFGLSPMSYGLCFACNAFGLVAGSAFVMKAANNPKLLLRFGVFGLLGACALTSGALLLGFSFPVFEAALFLMILCCGILIPLTTMLGLDSESENAGVAAALLGALSFLAGGVAAPLVGIGNMLVSVVVLFCVGSIASLVLWLVSRRYNYFSAEFSVPAK